MNAAKIHTMEVISFALNWRVYKSSTNTYWVGTDETLKKEFLDQKQAISFMLEQIYG